MLLKETAILSRSTSYIFQWLGRKNSRGQKTYQGEQKYFAVRAIILPPPLTKILCTRLSPNKHIWEFRDDLKLIFLAWACLERDISPFIYFTAYLGGCRQAKYRHWTPMFIGTPCMWALKSMWDHVTGTVCVISSFPWTKTRHNYDFEIF